MARPPTKIRLQKTLKEGLRRCVYRRWEAEVKGKVLTTKTTELERMYRGNTPYPIGQIRRLAKSYANDEAALQGLKKLAAKRRRLGYALRS